MTTIRIIKDLKIECEPKSKTCGSCHRCQADWCLEFQVQVPWSKQDDGCLRTQACLNAEKAKRKSRSL